MNVFIACEVVTTKQKYFLHKKSVFFSLLTFNVKIMVTSTVFVKVPFLNRKRCNEQNKFGNRWFRKYKRERAKVQIFHLCVWNLLE